MTAVGADILIRWHAKDRYITLRISRLLTKQIARNPSLEKMRVLIVSDFLEPVGGAEIYDKLLETGLEQRGHQTRRYGTKQRDSVLGLVSREFSSIYSFNHRYQLGKMMDTYNPDILFVHSIADKISPSFLGAARRRNIPIILKIANQFQYEYPLKWYAMPIWPKRFLHRYLVNRSVDGIIAPSESTAEWVGRNIDVDQVIVIPNPSPWDRPNKPVETEGLGYKILFAGRLTEGKGVEFLIRAAEILKRQIDQPFLVEIFGEGPQEEAFRELSVQLEVDDDIRFNGRIPHKELKNKYRFSDVFVLPSVVKENSPLTIPEAMSQGTPVITTNIGGQREVVEDGTTGLLIEPKDPNALANALERLSDPTLRRGMQIASLQFAERFGKQNHLEEIERFFSEFAG